ncbi:hypothetical protein EGM51_06845 [Verrucomicrobia bacterium S94]|nr:hypothetical protein EGM51_06845 [Verrucomicrobia bacterium S94]
MDVGSYKVLNEIGLAFDGMNPASFGNASMNGPGSTKELAMSRTFYIQARKRDGRQQAGQGLVCKWI